MRNSSRMGLVLSVVWIFALWVPLELLGSGPKIGAPAPPLNLARLLQAPDGAEATWKKLYGRVVVLEFWSTACGPCVRAFPHWNELVEQCRDKPITFIAISDENQGIVESFMKRQPIRSWVGLEGIAQSTRDRYQIEGIPTTVIVNQEGIVVAVTHPMTLKVKHLEEVVKTKLSSLPPPREDKRPEEASKSMSVKSLPPLFEVSIRRSGPRLAGHGVDCWSRSKEDGVGIEGEYASLQRAFEFIYRVLPLRQRLPANMPKVDYDIKLHLASENQQDMEQLFGIGLRQTFGMAVRRVMEERDVFVLTVGRTNAPGLQLFDSAQKRMGGQIGDGKLKSEHVTVTDLAGDIEQLLGTPVLDESGLTNFYTARMEWKLSAAELAMNQFSGAFSSFLDDSSDTNAWNKLSEAEKEIASAVRGKLPEAKVKAFSPELQDQIRLIKNELAKPADRQFSADPELIRQAVEEQLGLKLTPARRNLEILVVERIDGQKQ